MSKKKTWADVKKLDVVELGGREWTVAKIKAGKKKAHVRVEMGRRVAESDVKLADRVKIVGHAKSAPSSLHDEHGAQQRWAKKRELDEVMREGASLPAGDSKATKPPKKPKGGEWERPKGDAEKMIVDLLSARLVGESHDEKAGYYVPPVDVSTVAAHLELFHGGIPDAVSDDEGRMLAMHGAQHEAAATGAGVLAVNHWHTAKRP